MRSPGRAADDAADVIVVGTGFGGAVTAARLAQSGLRVLVFERGPWWEPAGAAEAAERRRALPRGLRGLHRWLHAVSLARGGRRRELTLRADGLLKLYLFEHLTALTGSGVGGGSILYGGVTEEPPEDFFDAFPDEVTAEEMRPYYDAVLDTLRASPMPTVPERNRLFEQAAVAAGLPAPRYPRLAIAWGKDSHARDGLVNAVGELQTPAPAAGIHTLGRSDRSKTTLDLTYVPLALRHGAELRALTEVEWVAASGDGYDVGWVDHVDGSRGCSRAPRVVLAAGTFGTLRLLFGARDRDRSLPNVSQRLGHGFSPNGDLTLLVREAQRLSGSDRAVSGKPMIERRLRGRPYVLAESELPLSVLPLPARLRARLARGSLFAGMGREARSATVRFERNVLATEVDRALDPELFETMEAELRAIAEHYEPKSIKTRESLVTVHPVGGAAIAATRERGVVDHRGQVFGHPGLYIADASTFPVAPGAAPSLAIAALAERQAELLAEEAAVKETRAGAR